MAHLVLKELGRLYEVLSHPTTIVRTLFALAGVLVGVAEVDFDLSTAAAALRVSLHVSV